MGCLLWCFVCCLRVVCLLLGLMFLFGCIVVRFVLTSVFVLFVLLLFDLF